MKKPIILITTLLFLTSLTSCGLFPNSNNNDSIESVTENSDDLDPLLSIVATDSYDKYAIGNTYSSLAISDSRLKVVAHYKSRGDVTIPYKSSNDVDGYSFSTGTDPNGGAFSPNSSFSISGTYKIKVFYKGFYSSYNINVKSGIDANYTISSISVVDKTENYGNGDYFLDNCDLVISLIWNTNIPETIYYVKDMENVVVELYETGMTVNVINVALKASTEYSFKVSITDKQGTSKISDPKSFTVSGGFYRINKINQTYSTISPASRTPAVGTQNIFILPIAWNGDEALATEANREIIRKGYLGTKEETKWNSLKTYYEEASYGQYSVNGYIAPWYQAELSLADTQVSTNQYSATCAINTAFAALEDFKTNNPTFDWSIYDTDNNGYIDSIHFVNTAVRNSDFYSSWGWQVALYDDLSGADVNSPSINCMAWFNVDFLTSLNDYCAIPTGGVNSRVIIHEHGHIVGLKDYYDYSGTIDAVGSWDMQSYNVGDWNPFSKFSAGWLKPYVIDGTYDDINITIRPSSEYGDAIVVPLIDESHTYSNTPFDEYLLIDYYTATGLNQSDANSLDSDRSDLNLRLNQSGVRIYHVDARLGTDEYSRVSFATNNDFKSAGGPYLLQLIQKGNVNTFASSSTSSRHYRNADDLFVTGNEFDMSTYSSFFYNNGELNKGGTIPYHISITQMNASGATIHISLS